MGQTLFQILDLSCKQRRKVPSSYGIKFSEVGEEMDNKQIISVMFQEIQCDNGKEHDWVKGHDKLAS